MRSQFDLKHNMAKLTPESAEDLEILRRVIPAGSLVTSKSPRSIKVKREGELVRAKTGRKEVVMTVKVEKVDLEDSLRINGMIVDAPEDVDRGYHTIDIEPDKFLTVEKEWKGWEVDMVRAAEKKTEPVLVCILDENEADFFMLKERYKFLVHLETESSGKRFDPKKAEERQKEYFAKLLDILRSKSLGTTKIIIAGPAFAKENLQQMVKEREKSLLPKIISDSTYQSGYAGLQELLKKGLIEKLTKISRVTDETLAVESLLQAVSGSGKAAYGAEKVRESIESGSARKILVSDEKIAQLEEVLDLADKSGIEIMVVSSGHAAGDKLLGLGGIASMLF
jgi:protein pelota